MPNSVRCIIKKCLYKGAITQKEYDKLMRKIDGWIPCEERLPEVGEDVFISVGRDVWEAHLRESKEYFLTHRTKSLVAEWEVDAWMPLPEPYEGREQNE